MKDCTDLFCVEGPNFKTAWVQLDDLASQLLLGGEGLVPQVDITMQGKGEFSM